MCVCVCVWPQRPTFIPPQLPLLPRMVHPNPNPNPQTPTPQDSWFLTDLPPDALRMNDKYLASSRPCHQTEADIRAIVQAATADHEPKWNNQLK